MARAPIQLRSKGGSVPEAPQIPAPAEGPAPVAAAKKGIKDRTAQVMAYINPDAHRALKQLALNEDKKLNDLLIEAINMLLRDRDLPANAEASKE